MEKRPDFETLASYEEFKKYYWYRKELIRYMQKTRDRIQGNQTGTESSYSRVLLRKIGGKERCTAPF